MFWRSSGVRREQGGVWCATDDDPQLVFAFFQTRPRFAVLRLEAVEGELSPTVYFNLGQGFSQSHAHSLSHRPDTSLYVLPLAGLPRVFQLRVDPAAGFCRFRWQLKTFYSRKSLNAFLRKTERLKQIPVLSENLSEIVSAANASPQTLADTLGLCWSMLHEVLPWAGRHDAAADARLLQQRAVGLGASMSPLAGRPAPTLSFVAPTYNTPPQFLSDLTASFLQHASPSAELVLSDDGSTSPATREALHAMEGQPGIRVVFNAQNGGIAAATNAGISAAQGEWVALIDHDDALVAGAIAQIQSAIVEHPGVQFLYTDEIIADGDLKPIGFHLKPAFDPVMLTGVNYINHLSVYRRDRLLQLGGLRNGFQGSQDYDLLLRYLSGIEPGKIVHIPFPAYLWRRTGSSYSAEFEAQSIANARKALASHFEAHGQKLTVGEAHSKFLHKPNLDEAIDEWPLVSVVIPSKDAYSLISQVLRDLYDKTDYPNFEVVVVDNGTTDAQVLALYDEFASTRSNFRLDLEVAPFNFARQINRGIKAAKGPLVLLLNNDIQVLEADWLKEMVSCFQMPDVGIVGAKLLYPDRSIQHAGIIVGFGGLAGHWYHRKPEDAPGPFARLHVRQSLSAVTGACMLISKECVERVGLLDESKFAVAYNDVDYCLRALKLSVRTVWTPFAVLIHHESVSRGSDELQQNRSRFQREKAALQEGHRTDAFEDPYFNPWLTKDRSEPALLPLKALPRPRTGTITPADG